MTLYVVYRNPKDFPDKFVVRRWEDNVPDPDPTIVTDSLEDARKAIPAWAHFCLARNPKDDPCIVETWL